MSEIIPQYEIEKSLQRCLSFIGEDVTREGLIDTPKRILNSWRDLFSGYSQNVNNIMTTFKDDVCNEMVILKDIELYSTCEHHMLPFFGKCHIAYIPNGKILGVSKLARLMEIYARRMQIQERIVKQITLALDFYLNPLGSACIIEAQHFCMTSRGVQKENSKMLTSSLTGVFKDDIEVRQEFLSLIKG